MIRKRVDSFFQVVDRSGVFDDLGFGESMILFAFTTLVGVLLSPFYVSSMIWSASPHKCKK